MTMMTTLSRAAALLCLLVPLAQAKPLVTETTQYYEFNATSRKEIWTRIQRLSPRGNVNVAGHHAVNVALTETLMAGNYQYQASLFKCRITRVEPTLQIRIHLPHWRNSWEADSKLADDWNRYVRMVSNHEDIHKQYAIRMAEEYEQALLALGPYKSCRELNEDVAKIKDRIIGKYRAKNKWFDAQEFVYQKELIWF